ncbi:MAG: HEPN domain-containing protein, partial [Spirochaetales bacterium]|nr:HEPN domain-containing protein [Spirochaetales bacterium]
DYGVYHLSGEGQCTWHEFSSEIYKQGKVFGLIESDCVVNPCASDEFPAKAKRPEFSLLSKEKVKSVLDYQVPDWKESLTQFMAEHNEVKSRVSNWLEHSEYDLETAEAMFSSERYLYVVITLQQTLEKIFKAVFEYKLKNIPRIHDLARLASSLQLILDDSQNKMLTELSYYYIASRYNERIKTLSSEVTKEKSQFYIERSKEIVKCIKSMIPFV